MWLLSEESLDDGIWFALGRSLADRVKLLYYTASFLQHHRLSSLSDHQHNTHCLCTNGVTLPQRKFSGKGNLCLAVEIWRWCVVLGFEFPFSVSASSVNLTISWVHHVYLRRTPPEAGEVEAESSQVRQGRCRFCPSHRILLRSE
ncbi:hypothetical protein R1flu_020692 [Riccia fluitans]|uniref:Uncharacterized protein n=1 Tax=Riccia fluitans TaxID=41844 RepID=A0ABD1ZQX9_9MARC